MHQSRIDYLSKEIERFKEDIEISCETMLYIKEDLLLKRQIFI